MTLNKLRNLLKKNGVSLRPVRHPFPPAPPKPVADTPEAELLKSAMRDVQPLTPHGRVLPESPRLAPLPRYFFVDERELIRESLEVPVNKHQLHDFEENASYVRPGLSRQTLRRLRGGEWHAQAELDLHGLIVVQARHEFADFLHECKRRRVRCVRIIHGKGLRSPNGESILKQQVRQWLMLRDEVQAFASARPAEGGSGAVVVLLGYR